jgi:hypothetical protein
MTTLTVPLATPTTAEKLLLAASRLLADHAHARMRARAERAEGTAQRNAAIAAAQRPPYEAEMYLRVR